MLELSKRKELRSLIKQLALVIFAFGVVVGVVVMGISSVAAEVRAEMVTPEMAFISDDERGPNCGLYTTNIIVAKAFVGLLDDRLTKEEFIAIVIEEHPSYGLRALKLFRDCNMNGGVAI